MNPLAQQVTGRGMHQALSLDPATPGKAVGHDQHPEMSLAALPPTGMAVMAR